MKKDSTSYGAVRPAWDRGDCSVRALATATGIPYEQASAVFSAAGRTLGKGTSRDLSQTVYEKWLKMIPVSSNMQLGYFIVLNPSGRFVLHKAGHAFALIDGVVHDWEGRGTGPGTQVLSAWEVSAETLERLRRAAGLLG